MESRSTALLFEQIEVPAIETIWANLRSRVGNFGHSTLLGPAMITRLRKPLAQVLVATSAVLLLAVLLSTCAAPARAAEAPVVETSTDPTTDDLQRLMLAPWLSRQNANGSFEEPGQYHFSSRYGAVSIAYAMLQHAATSGDDRYFESAIKAVEWFLGDKRSIREGVFVGMLSASAYNLVKQRFSDRPQWRKIKRRWSSWLSRRKPTSKRIDNAYRGNKKIVEAIEYLELLRSGVRSRRPGTVLADRARALTQVRVLMDQRFPEAAAGYRVPAGTDQGWPTPTELVVLSDPPQNPPAYHALVAAFYLRAYSLLAPRYRTATMRNVARQVVRGLVARMAPDGDLAFSARSQEQSWALTSAMFAAWKLAASSKGKERAVLLGFARRAAERLKSQHFDGQPSRGIFLVPAGRCCDGDERIPGQDIYFRITAYTGLTGMTLGWALGQRPSDWLTEAGRIPADNLSSFYFAIGAGRFLQHRGGEVFWMLREQGNNEDARYDMAVHVLKVQDGLEWVDAIPPRPYSGGHKRPADPASPCLVIKLAKDDCAYLSLRDGVPGESIWNFKTVWRDLSGHAWGTGRATVVPTADGLTISWSGLPGQVFKVDHFVQKARCTETGVRARALTLVVTHQADCRVVAGGYAGGAITNLDRVRSVADAEKGWLTVKYAAKPEPKTTPRRRPG